jgi:hypothetical protein
MSVVFLQEPDLYVSGFNPIVFKAESDEIAQPNFRYLVEIKDSIGTILSSFRLPPHYLYGTVKKDVHRTIENYLSYDIINLIEQNVGFKVGVSTFKEFYITVTEEYGSPSPSAQLDADSNTVYAINSAQSYLDWLNDTIQNRAFFAAGVQSATFLTNQPSAIKIRESDSYELRFISGTQFASPDHMRVKTYDSDGVLLKSSEFDNAEKANIDSDQRFLSILVGTDNINDWTVSAGDVQPLIASDVAYYEVSLESSVDVLVSEIKTFEIDRSCLTDDTYTRIFFLNSLGGFDAFNFTRPNIDTISVEKATYGKLQGVEDATTFTFNTYQHEKSNFFNKTTQNYKLSSGFVSTEESIWLKELIESPLLYMILDGQFVGVNILTASYEAKTTLREKLFNIEIDVELSIDTQRQRL